MYSARTGSFKRMLGRTRVAFGWGCPEKVDTMLGPMQNRGQEVSMRKRRRFSREFKLEAVRQLQQGRQLVDVGRELGVNPTVLRRWQDQVVVDPATAFPGNGRQRSEEAELQRLRKEVAQLRLERDFLKKAAAFFARESA